jgi:hypothetical protein
MSIPKTYARPPEGRRKPNSVRIRIRRRLASPIWPEKSEYLTFLHHEIHTPDAPVLAVLVGEPSVSIAALITAPLGP